MPRYFFIKLFVKIQVVGWPLYFGIMVLSNHYQYTGRTIEEQLLALSLIVMVFNICGAIMFLVLMTKWGVWGIVLLILGYWLSSKWILHLMYTYFPSKNAVFFGGLGDKPQDQYYWRMLNRYIGVLFLASSAVLYIKAKKNSKLRELEMLRRHKKEMEAKESQIAFLNAQINPHFLYNVLTNIKQRTMIELPEVTPMVEQLADLMRYNLETGKAESGKVVVQKEIIALNKYIELEKSRYDAIYIDFEVNGEEYWHKIPPGSLITLVENALKHGVSSSPEEPICVRLTLDEERMEFSCSNKIRRYRNDDGSTGLGLQNLRKRLDLLFPNQYSLECGERSNEWFVVKLIIEQNG